MELKCLQSAFTRPSYQKGVFFERMIQRDLRKNLGMNIRLQLYDEIRKELWYGVQRTGAGVGLIKRRLVHRLEVEYGIE